MYRDLESQQKLENILTEQPDLMKYEEPSIYNNQMPSRAHFSTTSVYTSDLAQYDGFVFEYPQPGAAEHFMDSFFTLVFPTARQAGPTHSSPPSSPLTRLNISTPSSLLAPPRNVLPTEQTPSARGSTQENGPREATKCCTYAYKPLDITPTS